MSNSPLSIAREYVARGLSVVPIPSGKKAPRISWKKYQMVRPTDDELVKWFSRGQSNIGIVTGALSGITVVDFDTEDAISAAREKGFLSSGPIVKTGKGVHAYCRYEPGHSNFQKREDLPGIDLRGEGGLVVAPPSVHATGHEYIFIDGHGLDQPLPQVPEWIIKPQTASKAGFQLPDMIMSNRNDNLFRSVCSDLKLNNSAEGAWIRVQEINNTRCFEPLPRAELMALFNSAVKKYSESVRQENLSDLGNAERLVRNYGDRFHYVPEFKKWLLWDGTRWVTDTPSGVKPLAFQTVRDMIEEAQGLRDEQRTALIRHSLKSESKGAIEAMICLAEAIQGVPIQQSKLDRDHDVLNVINGTIDLKTGTLLPHNQSDYITRRAGVEYNLLSTCPIWERFLDQIMNGDQEMIDYIQKAIGYSLTGHTREQCLFIPYGEGSNGKSVFLKTIENILADYSTHCPADALMVKGRSGGVNNEVARLRGARFVAAVETDEGKRLSESLIKEMTGGDTITARFLFSEFFEFIPAFKVWLACNHKPVIRGTDHAIWRRIRLIPFLVTIPEAEQDKELADKLKAEASGILSWAVRGCLKWYAEGLKSPDKVMMATAEYRAEMDIIGAWIDSNCKIDDRSKDCKAGYLYDDYKTWAEENGEWVMSAKMLFLKLAERGFHKVKKTAGTYYQGICLKSRQTDGPEKSSSGGIGPYDRSDDSDDKPF